MASVFSTDTGAPIVVRAGKAILTINGATMLAIGVTVTFARNVEKIPTIGGKSVVSLSEGSGTLNVNTILAKNQDVLAALNVTGDGCSSVNASITFKDATCGMSGKTITAMNCFASNISMSMEGARGVIMQGVTMTFTALDI